MKNKTHRPSLGASEFAATLNGDNPQAILKVLKQFAKTVKKERRIALSSLEEDEEVVEFENESEEKGYDVFEFDRENEENDSDDEDSSSDDEDEDETSMNPPPVKKLKKSEEWKEDTLSYQVPFVGTSVAKSDNVTTPVVKGEWPTGLLQAYLTKSPLAMELTNDDLVFPEGQIHKSLIRKKRGKLSRAISKVYLKALAELVTAAVPRSKLVAQDDDEDAMDTDQKKDQINNTYNNSKFLPILLKQRLQGIFKLLNDETNRGKGKYGVYGGCGSLAAPALQLLQTISMISTTQARLVARYLEEEVSEGVLRSLLRPPPPPKQKKATEKEENGNNDKKEDADQEEDISKTKVPTKHARVEAIHLATALLHAEDSAVATYICTSGSRERKVKPGILFIALREGLAAHQQQQLATDVTDEKYLDSVADMLECIRSLLLKRKPTSRGIINQRQLFELLSRDPLNHLWRFASQAPPMTTDVAFSKVLDCTDSYDEEDMDALPNAGMEARRLLFPLLADSSHSPFLGARNNLQSPKSSDGQQLVRTLIRLFQTPRGGMQMRKFAIHCIQQTPCLLPEIFRVLALPETKKSFDFISSIGFVSNLLRQGPSPLDCLPTSEMHFTEIDCNEVLLAVLPVKFKRHPIAKAIQTGNALVVLECLKLIHAALQRFDTLKSECRKDAECSEDYLYRLSTAFALWLPDLQILLALRGRFDGFSSNKSHILISDCLYRVLESFCLALPFQITESKFDWMKLVPNAGQFSKAVPLIQRRVLACLKSTIRIFEGLPSNFLNSCNVILEIMLQTKCSIVHERSRTIALIILITAMQSKYSNSDTFPSIEREASCWVDALTNESLPTFCNLLNRVQNKGLSIMAGAGGGAWKKDGISKSMEFSLLLVASLSVTNAPPAFSILVTQVTARNLLFQRNPIPLASLIRHVFDIDDGVSVMKSNFANPLVRYAKSLVDFDDDDASTRLNELGEMLSSIFSSRDTLVNAYTLLTQSSAAKRGEAIDEFDFPQAFDESLALVKFLVHFQLISTDTAKKADNCWHMLRRTLPTVVLKCSSEHSASSVFKDVFIIRGQVPSKHFHVLDLQLLACPFTSHLEVILARLEEFVSHDESLAGADSCDIISTKNQRIAFLRLSLLGGMLPENSAAKVAMNLARTGESDKHSSDLILRLFLSFAKSTSSCDNLDATYEPVVLQRLFHAWWSLSGSKNALPEGSLGQQVRAHFGSVVAKVLNHDNVQASVLVGFMNERAARGIIDRCLGFATEDNSEGGMLPQKEDMELLKAILRSDSLRYTAPFLNKFGSEDLALSRAWRNGWLDEAILVILNQAKVLTSDGLYVGLVNSILSRAVPGLKEIAEGDKELDEATNFFKMVMIATDSFQTSIDPTPLAGAVLEILHSALNKKKLVRNCAFFKLAMALAIERQSYAGCQVLVSVKRKLAPILLVLLSESLLHSYKHPSTNGDSEPETRNILEWLIALVNDVDDFDVEILKDVKPSLLQKICRNCLKNGIAGSTEHQQNAAMSLHLVRVLLSRLYGPQSPIKKIKETLIVPSPSEVLMMMTMHSQFDAALSRKEEGTARFSTDCERLELVRLMCCCVELSPMDVTIRAETWSVLYLAFNAGLSELDTAIRQLFYACCTSTSKDVHLPFLDEFRWMGCPDSDSREGRRWDWFLDALDTSRVRVTLSQFPLLDTVDLDTELTEDIGKDEEKEESMDGHESDGESGENEVMEDAYSTPKEERIAEKDPVPIGLAPGSSWAREAADLRYSPAFLLPFILGALESGLKDGEAIAQYPSWNESSAMEEQEYIQTTKSKFYNDAFVSIARRLCEKGALSLCLGSLSSRCETVRGYAISILGLLVRACDTEEARTMSSWRERPQLAMILNAVQRAFVLKQASNTSASSSLRIPILPPVVAIFLARAALSISQPGDALYVPLNRYFLKTEANHGAFQDMNRLPGFISLFCSSSDDPTQTRKERLWALQLLRDGFLDSSCYRLVASCHAPELILSSFENVRLSHFSDDMKDTECSLLLDVFKTFLYFGSNRAASPLVMRIGLLSWMRSLCTSRPIVESFPGINTRISFCELVCSAVKAASLDPRLRSDTLVQEVCGLAQPIVDICSDLPKKSDSRLIQVAFRAFDSLREALSILENDGFEHSVTHPLGVSIHSGLGLLELSPSDLRDSVTLSLSLAYLPVCFLNDSSVEEASQFCLSLLQCGRALDNETAIGWVLDRVFLIANYFGGCLALNCNVLGTLLAARSKFVLAQSNKELWLKCLRLLALNAPDSGFEATAARRMIQSAELTSD